VKRREKKSPEPLFFRFDSQLRAEKSQYSEAGNSAQRIELDSVRTRVDKRFARRYRKQ
jgi:hypothetical protein